MPRHFNGGRLRQARKAAGESPADVARAIDRSASLVYLVEEGYRVPAAETLDDWCQHLGIPIDFVFTDDETVPA